MSWENRIVGHPRLLFQCCVTEKQVSSKFVLYIRKPFVNPVKCMDCSSGILEANDLSWLLKGSRFKSHNGQSLNKTNARMPDCLFHTVCFNKSMFHCAFYVTTSSQTYCVILLTVNTVLKFAFIKFCKFACIPKN